MRLCTTSLTLAVGIPSGAMVAMNRSVRVDMGSIPEVFSFRLSYHTPPGYLFGRFTSHRHPRHAP